MGNEVSALRGCLEAAQHRLDERGDVTLDSGLAYRAGEPIRVRIRHRDHRYDLTDDGAAVGFAGKPPGWLDAAERVVAREAMNVNRRGIVFVPAAEGRDIADLAFRLAESSRQVYLALLDLTPSR